MSFDLFVQCFAGGQPSGFPTEAVRAAFGRALSEPEDDFWQLHYGPTESSDLFFTPHPSAPSLIHSLSVHRPCAAAGLFEGLWQLLELPGTCLYFPGDSAPMTRDPAMLRNMPARMIEALGTPVQLESPAALARAVREGMA